MIENIPEKVKNIFLSMIPLRRFGSPEGMSLTSYISVVFISIQISEKK